MPTSAATRKSSGGWFTAFGDSIQFAGICSLLVSLYFRATDNANAESPRSFVVSTGAAMFLFAYLLKRTYALLPANKSAYASIAFRTIGFFISCFVVFLANAWLFPATAHYILQVDSTLDDAGEILSAFAFFAFFIGFYMQRSHRYNFLLLSNGGTSPPSSRGLNIFHVGICLLWTFASATVLIVLGFSGDAFTHAFWTVKVGTVAAGIYALVSLMAFAGNFISMYNKDAEVICTVLDSNATLRLGAKANFACNIVRVVTCLVEGAMCLMVLALFFEQPSLMAWAENTPDAKLTAAFTSNTLLSLSAYIVVILNAIAMITTMSNSQLFPKISGLLSGKMSKRYTSISSNGSRRRRRRGGKHST